MSLASVGPFGASLGSAGEIKVLSQRETIEHSFSYNKTNNCLITLQLYNVY